VPRHKIGDRQEYTGALRWLSCNVQPEQLILFIDYGTAGVAFFASNFVFDGPFHANYSNAIEVNIDPLFRHGDDPAERVCLIPPQRAQQPYGPSVPGCWAFHEIVFYPIIGNALHWRYRRGYSFVKQNEREVPVGLAPFLQNCERHWAINEQSDTVHTTVASGVDRLLDDSFRRKQRIETHRKTSGSRDHM